MQSEFTNAQLDSVFENSFNLVNYGNGKLTSQKGQPPFSACIACGLIAKSMGRLGMDLPATCHKCFADHCWNGTVQNTPQYPYYDPDLLLDSSLSFADWNKTVWNAER
jgi:lysophospholipase